MTIDQKHDAPIKFAIFSDGRSNNFDNTLRDNTTYN